MQKRKNLFEEKIGAETDLLVRGLVKGILELVNRTIPEIVREALAGDPANPARKAKARKKPGPKARKKPGPKARKKPGPGPKPKGRGRGNWGPRKKKSLA